MVRKVSEVEERVEAALSRLQSAAEGVAADCRQMAASIVKAASMDRRRDQERRLLAALNRHTSSMRAFFRLAAEMNHENCDQLREVLGQLSEPTQKVTR